MAHFCDTQTKVQRHEMSTIGVYELKQQNGFFNSGWVAYAEAQWTDGSAGMWITAFRQ